MISLKLGWKASREMSSNTAALSNFRSHFHCTFSCLVPRQCPAQEHLCLSAQGYPSDRLRNCICPFFFCPNRLWLTMWYSTSGVAEIKPEIKQWKKALAHGVSRGWELKVTSRLSVLWHQTSGNVVVLLLLSLCMYTTEMMRDLCGF